MDAACCRAVEISGQILGSDGFEWARLQRVWKKMEYPQHCHSEAPAFGARNLLFLGIPVEKQIPPPPRSEFEMTVAEASGLSNPAA